MGRPQPCNGHCEWMWPRSCHSMAAFIPCTHQQTRRHPRAPGARRTAGRNHTGGVGERACGGGACCARTEMCTASAHMHASALQTPASKRHPPPLTLRTRAQARHPWRPPFLPPLPRLPPAPHLRARYTKLPMPCRGIRPFPCCSAASQPADCWARAMLKRPACEAGAWRVRHAGHGVRKCVRGL